MSKYSIIAYLQPFILEQKIEVYKDGECMNIMKCTFNEMESMILELVEKYNIKEITLAGSAQIYSYKLKSDLISKYSQKNININILE